MTSVTHMFGQPDPPLLEVFDAVHEELARALEARERLDDAISDIVESASRAAIRRKIAGLKIILAELQVAIERRHSHVVH
jgi:hypothetical protein